MRVEILTEEPSMEYFLSGFLPRILPTGHILNENCFIRSHEGKTHLLKSIPGKMRAYSSYHEVVKVLIIHDQDSNDCIRLKQQIKLLCMDTIPVVIRIACKELENWYLGDFHAIEKTFPDVKADKYMNKAKFRNPDKLNGSQEMKLLTKEFSKTSTAREMGSQLSTNHNKSKSFNHFVSGLMKLLEQT